MLQETDVDRLHVKVHWVTIFLVLVLFSVIPLIEVTVPVFHQVVGEIDFSII